MIYPKGTPILDIRYWDRSTRVFFTCTEHPAKVWASKQPAVSSWFARDEQVPDVCQHDLAHYSTTEEYNDGREG